MIPPAGRGAQRDAGTALGGNEPEPHARGLTDSRLPVGQVGRDGDPPPLPRAQALQGLVHPLDHVAQTHVGVVGAVALVTDGKKPEGLFSKLSEGGRCVHGDLESKAVPSWKVPL